MDLTPKEMIMLGVAGLVAIADPLVAPFILIGAGVLFILVKL